MDGDCILDTSDRALPRTLRFLALMRVRLFVLAAMVGISTQSAWATVWRSPESSETVTIEKQIVPLAPAGKPWLVVYVFDKSGSMLQECGADPRGARRTNWQVVVEDAQSKLAQLHGTLKAFDLRMYAFGNSPARFDDPLFQRSFSVGSAQDVRDIQSEIGAIPLPKSGEATNLWNSLASVFDGLDRTKASATYGGALVVVFSDGADSVPTLTTPAEARKRAMLASLTRARSGLDTRISILPIGEWLANPAQVQQLGAIGDVAELGKAIEIPTTTTLVSSPVAVQTGPLPESGSTATVDLRFVGFSDADAAATTFSLREGTTGLSIAPSNVSAAGGRLVLRADRPLDLGANAWVVVTAPAAGAAASITSFKVVVPSFRKVAPIAQWGLPSECAALGGKRGLVLPRGEPLELSVSAPAGARVDWSVDGAPAGSGSTLVRRDLAAGLHAVRVSVSTNDDRKDADVTVAVIDTALAISVPPSARAGDSVRAKVEVPALPGGLAAALSPAVWTVQGNELPGRDGVEVRFDRRGSERISVRQVLDVCGRQFNLSASAVVEVRPGPALRLVGGELVRGRENRIEALLSEPAEISRVLFLVDGETIEGSIDAASGDRPATAWFRRSFAGGATLTVKAVPILKDDRGVDRAATDPECERRAQTRTFTFVDPDVVLTLQQPTQGSVLPFGANAEIRALPEGRDAEAVERVRVRIAPQNGTPVELELTRAGNWSASFTPKATMGGGIVLRAEAFDATGTVATPIEASFGLAALRPELVLTGAATSGSLSWTGQNSSPPPITAAIVVAGTKNAYPAEGLTSVSWKVGDGLAIESRQDGDRALVCGVRAAGVHAVEATVRTADGKSHLLRREVAVRPEPLVPAPELKSVEFGHDAPVEFDHAKTVGAWTDAVVRLRRGGSDWVPFTPGTALSPVPTASEAVEFEVWYRPWGVGDSAAPWSEGTGWVTGKVLNGMAAVPRNWVLPAIAALVALILSIAWWKQCSGHNYAGLDYEWTTDNRAPVHGQVPLAVEGFDSIALSEGSRYSFMHRTACIEYPARRDRRREWSWLAKPQLGDALVNRAHLVIDQEGNISSKLPAEIASPLGVSVSLGGVYHRVPPPPLPLDPNESRADWESLYIKFSAGEHARSVGLQYRLYLISGLILIWAIVAWLVFGHII
jgi:hypothetical protein